jgi:hypothetical protein
VKRTLVAAVALLGAVPMVGQVQAKPQPATFVFSGEGNRMNAYDAATGEKQTVIWSASDPATTDGREHKDLNAQVCFHEFDGATYFIAGEDTGQDQGGVGNAGWGWFRLDGEGTGDVHKLRTAQRGKLVPTYAADADPAQHDNPENYGCGFLDNGVLALSDVGDQQPQSGANGQLHLWFPDAAEGFGKGFDYSPGPITEAGESDIPYCFIDRSIPTAGGIWVDRGDPFSTADDAILVASSRPDFAHPEKGWGILRYDGVGSVRPAPNGDPAACDTRGVTRTVFIQGGPQQLTPSAIVASGHGTYYVSSVFDGNVAEYSPRGAFMGYVVGGTPTGQLTGLLPEPLAVGTPYGLGVTPDGSVWYADIGVVGNGPNRPGRVMRVTPSGAPLPSLATIVDDGLAFPDGIGVLTVHDRR